jgi:hypothetical protein
MPFVAVGARADARAPFSHFLPTARLMNDKSPAKAGLPSRRTLCDF